MQKLIPLLLIAVLLAGTSSLAEPFYLPYYYPQSDFLVRTPGSAGDASGAFFNPAVWGMMKGPEAQFFWNDQDDDSLKLKNWALMLGGKGIGFTVQHWDYGEVEFDRFNNPYITRHALKDYTIGFGGGDEQESFGIAYSWSRGTQGPGMMRNNVLSFGSLQRPNRYASISFVGSYALKDKDLRGVLDLGIRPLGTNMLTLYGDAAMGSKDRFEDVLWAAGASVEPLPGIAIVGKYFQGGSYMAGLSLTVSGFTGSALPHFDKDSEQTYTTYGVRIGFPKPDLITNRVMKDKMYLNMKFDNAIKYQRYKLFDNKGHTLVELLETLDMVKNDPRVGGLAIKITEDMYSSPEIIWEVREKIKDIQTTGKKVVVFFERGGMMQYYLASVADKVMVDPQISATMLGFNFGRSYYKNMLGKLGIGFDEWRFFKYKSAAEGLSRTDMSDADREQRGELANDFYDVYREDICQSREITHDEFDHIVNNVGILSADSLISYKLADTTGRWDDIGDYIKSLEGKDRKRIGRLGLTAMQPQYDEWGIKPRVAVIYALGVCSMNSGINARRLGPVIKRARENKHIKAVVFRADSPGGDALPSDIVAVELKKTAEEKPVIVSQGQVAGSGGYWISMYGDKIVVSPWTITGSIGVIGGWLYNDGFNEKLGLSYDHVQKGDHADLGRGALLPIIGAGIPDRNLTPEEREVMEKNIRLMYKDFVTMVSEGRDMTYDEVHEVAQGRVWSGTDGIEKGLVDELGGLEHAIKLARDAAEIDPDRRIEIVEMPQKGVINPRMFSSGMLGIKLRHPELETGDPDLDYVRMLIQAEGRPLMMVPPDMYLFWK